MPFVDAIPSDIGVGDRVVHVSHVLGACEQLNGCYGKVLRLVESSGRYEVQLDGIEGTKAMQARNLHCSL